MKKESTTYRGGSSSKASRYWLGKYINLKNLPSGAKVHIEVYSLVDELTGEILQRQSYKIWL